MIFFILKFTDTAQESVESVAARVNKTVYGNTIKSFNAETDSLKRVIQSFQAEIFLNKLTSDSLIEQNTMKDRLVTEYQTLLKDKEKEVLALTKRRVSSKAIAKTYESMKPAEMRPILVKVDNETIEILYESMSGRNRKSLLQALPPSRAASLTRKMAGS